MPDDALQLTNGNGKSACELKEWMQSPQCKPPLGDSGANAGGGSSRRDVGGTGRGGSDDGGGDGQVRRSESILCFGATKPLICQAALNKDDNQTPPISSCTWCDTISSQIQIHPHLPDSTPQFFNIFCGCLLTNGSNLDTVNYTDWRTTCEQNGLSLASSTSWLNALGQDLPNWAFVQLNGQSFNSQVVWDRACHLFSFSADLQPCLSCIQVEKVDTCANPHSRHRRHIQHRSCSRDLRLLATPTPAIQAQN